MENATINSWIDLKVNEMKSKIKRNRKRYFTFSIILLLINIATIILASIAIDMLVSEGSKDITSLVLSCLSVGFIIILFLLNGFAVFWKGIMKDKIYKRAIEDLQHQQMLFVHNVGIYDVEEKEKILDKKCNKIYSDAINSNKKVKSSLLLKIFVGGNDV